MSLGIIHHRMCDIPLRGDVTHPMGFREVSPPRKLNLAIEPYFGGCCDLGLNVPMLCLTNIQHVVYNTDRN